MPIFVTRRKPSSVQPYTLGRVYARTFLRKDYHIKRVTYLVALDPAELAAEATLTASCSVLLQASTELSAQSVLSSQTTLVADASNTLEVTTIVTCQSAIDCTANNAMEAIATISSVATILADATVVGMTATLACSCTFTAEGAVEAAPQQQQPTGVDWQNTLGAAPGPISGWAGGVGNLPPAIAITFIYGKHIYSDVKRRRRDITVNFESLTQEINEVKIDLVEVSKKSRKPRFKMKANNGKVHLVEK